MKTAQLAVKEHGIIDRDGLLLKAEARFAELITIEADEGAQRKDIQSLKRWVYLGTCVTCEYNYVKTCFHTFIMQTRLGR